MARRDDASETSEESTDRTVNATAGDASEGLLRRAGEETYERVEAADGLEKGVLLAAEHGTPNFALRRFTLDSRGRVPRHTNEIEHEQYVLAGEYVVGIGEEEYSVAAGDSLFVPAGVPHWYRNDSDAEGAFLCAVPNGEDEIRLVENSSGDEDATEGEASSEGKGRDRLTDRPATGE